MDKRLMQSARGMDVGPLYAAMTSVSDRDLETVALAGLYIGHSGVLDHSYAEMNRRALLARGASEKEVEVLLKPRNGKVPKVFEKYGVFPLEPTRERTLRALRQCVVHRDSNIQIPSTSAGVLYRRCFGERLPDAKRTVIAKFGELRFKITDNFPYDDFPDELATEARRKTMLSVIDHELGVKRVYDSPSDHASVGTVLSLSPGGASTPVASSPYAPIDEKGQLAIN